MEPTPTQDWLSPWLMRLCAQNTTSGQEDQGLRDLLAQLDVPN
jgi:hypothetical protein